MSARVTLGWSLLDIGEYDEAFAQLKTVNKRAPDNLAAIRGLAELHERGIGLSFDAMPDDDAEMELDPVMPAFGAVSVAADADDEVLGDLAVPDELDPVMPALEAAHAPDLDLAGDLDPIVEPETPMAPAMTQPPFEIEDVIDAGEPDSMFDLSSLFALELDHTVSNVIAMPEPVVQRRALPVIVERAPLALRDQAESVQSEELAEWLARVRERRTESVSQYMAG